MPIADLSNVISIFRGGDRSDDQGALFNEVLLMTLARATSADANIDACEISTVQAILKEETGEDFTDADIRLASRPTLYEDTPLSRYLRSVRKKLTSSEISHIASSLAKVIHSDTNIRELEIDFFNEVADSLRATPAEIAGLVAD